MLSNLDNNESGVLLYDEDDNSVVVRINNKMYESRRKEC